MTADPHVSQLMLDALALRALDRDSEARVHAHLAGCASCREAAQIAAQLRQRFTVHVLPRGVPARRRQRRSWLLLPALAVALLAIGWRSRPAPVAELGIKGTASWQVFANHDGRVFAVHDGTALKAGDRIRFAVAPAGARYLLVASIDGLGTATIYYPYDGPQSAIIEGDRVEPAGSIELDAAPGPERIYALLSDEPIAADPVIEQLRAVAAGGADAIRDARALELPVRAQLSLVFEKATP
jgi:putative zinc finger protein